jgi:hypothetical protein
MSLAERLNPDKALIFRITHRDNVPWILEHGLHCRSADVLDPDFVAIGNQELIDKRQTRRIDVPPGGTLSDYIPFYFTPYTPMLLNIKTGKGGVKRRSSDEIAILVSALPRLVEVGVPFLITDQHAYMEAAQFSSDPANLREWIPWRQIQERNFRRNPDDPRPFERYQAEALIHRHLPVEALLGVVCYTEAVGSTVELEREQRNLDVKVLVKPGWYL